MAKKPKGHVPVGFVMSPCLVCSDGVVREVAPMRGQRKLTCYACGGLGTLVTPRDLTIFSAEGD